MPDPVSNLLQKHRDDMLKAFDTTVDQLDELALSIESLNLRIDTMSTVSRVCEKTAIWMSVHLEPDETLTERATPILRHLAQKGIHLDAKNGECPYEDYPRIGRREWKLANGRVRLALFVSRGDGAKCTYKKTGTKMEDVYEIVCE